MGFLTALCLLFIGLKLAGVLAWPWWLVLSPLLAELALLVCYFVAWVWLAARPPRGR